MLDNVAVATRLSIGWGKLFGVVLERGILELSNLFGTIEDCWQENKRLAEIFFFLFFWYLLSGPFKVSIVSEYCKR